MAKARFARRLYLFLLGAFLYLPLGALCASAFNDAAYSARWQGFTGRWFLALAADGGLWLAALRSALLAIGTAALALPLAFAAALADRAPAGGRRDGRAPRPGASARAFRRLVLACLIIPDLVLGLGLLALWSTCGWPLGWASLLAAHVAICLPFAYLVLRARLGGGGLALEEAAADLGAGPARIFLSVTLPRAAPALRAAAALTVALSLDDYVVSFFTAGAGTTTLPLHLQGLLRLGIQPKASALCVLILGAAFFIFLLRQRKTHATPP